MDPEPGRKGPDGFNDQTLLLAFHLTGAGTVTSDWLYPVSSLPHEVLLMPWKFFTESGVPSHSPNLTPGSLLMHSEDSSSI